MKKKNICKHILDLCMSVSLLFLMAYQVTGEKAHEWLGMAMFALIVAHNLLNIKWYAAIFRGRYHVLRVSRTLINILLLTAMLATMVSGILMNNFVYPLSISGTMATARVLHLAGSYWSFVLMSIHLGLHWGIITGFADKKLKQKTVRSVIFLLLRLLAAGIAVYGGYLFLSADIFEYMTFQTHFAFLDYDRLPVLVICDQIGMMSLWVFLSYYFTRIVQHFSGPQNRKKAQWGGQQ